MRHHCAGNHQRSKDVKVICAADRSARRNECRSRKKIDRGFGSGCHRSRRFGRCRAEGREGGGRKKMKAKKIAFTGIPVTDIKRARAFYEGVLGLKVSAEFGEGVWIEYEIGPDTLAIGSVGDQWKPSEDGTSVAIEVEDFDAAIKSLKQAKARFAVEGIESPVCWMAVVQDPDGNKIIIHKLKPKNEKGICK